MELSHVCHFCSLHRLPVSTFRCCMRLVCLFTSPLLRSLNSSFGLLPLRFFSLSSLCRFQCCSLRSSSCLHRTGFFTLCRLLRAGLCDFGSAGFFCKSLFLAFSFLPFLALLLLNSCLFFLSCGRYFRLLHLRCCINILLRR
ncbi:hypothetical protein KC19_2G111000 [Ceratodon purpureus]|uniref:Uncharacterized protein n=1 Tax=Ceratodon purpureus TaxID=3225 RepID=A0A8T0IUR1_CERPU|nr:hypothetical protein KC19_2G111000 [Ceratodon purpureus]